MSLQNSPSRSPQNSPQGSPQGTLQNSPQGSPQDSLQDSPQDSPRELLQTGLLTVLILLVGTIALPLLIAAGCKVLLVIFSQPLLALKYIGIFSLGYLTRHLLK